MPVHAVTNHERSSTNQYRDNKCKTPAKAKSTTGSYSPRGRASRCGKVNHLAVINSRDKVLLDGQRVTACRNYGG